MDNDYTKKKCVCCGKTLKFPKDAKTIRCPLCLMITRIKQPKEPMDDSHICSFEELENIHEIVSEDPESLSLMEEKLKSCFGDWRVLCQSFRLDEQTQENEDTIEILISILNEYKDFIIPKISELLKTPFYHGCRDAMQYVIFIVLIFSEYSEDFFRFLGMFAHADEHSQLSIIPSNIIKNIVSKVKSHLHQYMLKTEFNFKDWRAIVSVQALSVLYYRLSSPNNLPLSLFQLEFLVDRYDFYEDYHEWLSSSKSKKPFCLCQYPIAIPTSKKLSMLNYEKRILSGMNETPLNIQINKESCLQDTLQSFRTQRSLLCAPIHIKFKSVTSAGLNELEFEANNLREWIDFLIIDLTEKYEGVIFQTSKNFQVLKPLYPITPTSFIRPPSQHSETNASIHKNLDLYELLGMVLGISVLNQIPISVKFPKFYYKKILGRQVSLPDFRQVNLLKAKQLEQMKSYTLDHLEDQFRQHFVTETIDESSNNKSIEVLLSINGDEVPVVQGNKSEYINRVLDWELGQRVDKQMVYIRTGFFAVCAGNVIGLFEPDEILQLTASF